MRISDWSSDVCSSDLLVADRILTGRQVGADIGETAFIGRLALRIGIAAAQVEAETVEPELADELGVDQLAFVPGGVLFHDVAVGLVAVGAEPHGRGSCRARECKSELNREVAVSI